MRAPLYLSLHAGLLLGKHGLQRPRIKPSRRKHTRGQPIRVHVGSYQLQFLLRLPIPLHIFLSLGRPLQRHFTRVKVTASLTYTATFTTRFRLAKDGGGSL